jgi:ABC-type sugar transport system ATPase subunit
MAENYIIEAEGLTKNYDKLVAVDNLNLKIKSGEIYGLLGPNGAGKTTTILMILGLSEPTSGKVFVDGYNSTTQPIKVKQIAGYLPDNIGFYEDLTGKENLRFTAELNGFKGLAHIGISTGDIKRSKEFYIRNLGFTDLNDAVIERPDGRQVRLAFVGLNGLVIEFVEDLAGTEQSQPGSINHIAIEVEGLDTVMETLKQRGIEFESERPRKNDKLHGGIKLAFMKGPNGERIELYEYL